MDKLSDDKLSDRVNLAMKRKGINKSDLEEITQVAHGTIIAITNGERDDLNLSADTLYKLCNALDVTSDYLLGITDTLPYQKICDVFNYNRNGLDVFCFDKLYVTYDLLGYVEMPICAIDRNQTIEEIMKHVLDSIESFDVWSMPIETFDVWLNGLKEGYHEELDGYEPNTLEWYRRTNEMLYDILEDMEYKLKFEYLEWLEGKWK